MSKRVDKNNYYLDIAQTVSERGTCLRRNYGSVIVKDDEIVSTGYTGAPRGVKNCSDTGKCIRKEMNIERGTRYELCCSVHSEANAIISASRKDMIESTLYLVGVEKETGELVENAMCCEMCKRLVINAGIKKVIVRIDKDNYKEINVSDWINVSGETIPEPKYKVGDTFMRIHGGKYNAKSGGIISDRVSIMSDNILYTIDNYIYNHEKGEYEYHCHSVYNESDIVLIETESRLSIYCIFNERVKNKPAPKYKVGQKFKLPNDNVTYEINGLIGYINEEYIYHANVVNNINDKGTITEQSLDKAELIPEPKYKIGDRFRKIGFSKVYVINNHNYNNETAMYDYSYHNINDNTECHIDTETTLISKFRFEKDPKPHIIPNPMYDIGYTFNLYARKFTIRFSVFNRLTNEYDYNCSNTDNDDETMYISERRLCDIVNKSKPKYEVGLKFNIEGYVCYIQTSTYNHQRGTFYYGCYDINHDIEFIIDEEKITKLIENK